MSTTKHDLKVEHFVPDPAVPAHEVVSRWSNNGVERPAIVVTPQTEDDIIEAVLYARKNGLYVVPADGGHGMFVPITADTLYLNMSKFNRVSLDESTGTAHIGGGALTGQVIAELTDHGWYTMWPNSDAVGFVGCLLGGGSSTLNGVQGFLIDAVVSFRVVTAEGKIVEVSEKSHGDELDLFHALCGAGHGLAVVASVTTRMWPLAGLKMPEDKMWTRTLIFPGTAISLAAETFIKLRPGAPKLNTTLAFLRAPPSAPMPGAPTTVLSAKYSGPWDEAERYAALLSDPSVVESTHQATTAGLPFPLQNKAFEHFNVHGGFKLYAAVYLKNPSVEAVVDAFNLWLQFTTDIPDATASTLVLGRWSTDKLVSFGETPEGKARHYDSRDRGTVAYTVAWYNKEESTPASEKYIEEYLANFHRHDGSKPRTFANGLRMGMNLEEVHEKDRIAKLEQISKTWDPERVFWSPYGRGWAKN